MRAGASKESAPTQFARLAIGLLAVLLIVLAIVIWRFPLGGPPGLRETPQEIQPPGQAPPAGQEQPKRRTRPRTAARTTPAFPMAGEIPEGMPKAELLQKFGQPAMISTAVELGQVVETLVYIRRGLPTTETVVALKNGTVVTVTTTNR